MVASNPVVDISVDPREVCPHRRRALLRIAYRCPFDFRRGEKVANLRDREWISTTGLQDRGLYALRPGEPLQGSRLRPAALAFPAETGRRITRNARHHL